MRPTPLALVLVAAASVWGCSGPSLDVPPAARAKLEVDLEPAPLDGSVALLFRARLHGVPAFGAPWLLRGELSDYYARALKHGDLPTALADRAVPLRYWRDGSDCWLQPLDWLEPDALYTLAFTGVGTVRVVRTQTAGEPRVRRLFPPVGSRKYRASVLCDASGSGLLDPLMLQPGGISLTVTSGMAGVVGGDCITLVADAELVEPMVAPPVLAGALLEPSPWLPSSGAVSDEAVPCAAGTSFHGACLEVLDDRLRVTPGVHDLFFALEQPESVVLATRAGSRSLLLGQLSPSSAVALGGRVLSSRGTLETFQATVTTTAAQRHVLLNEVLANPVGPEPDAEWIELFNDSQRAASLAGLWLEDAGGHVQLPSEELAPGELALLVSEGFRASGLDVAVPDGVRLLRVPSLGARGLSNGGEGLLLVGPEGVLSRFPLLSAAHAGKSMARRWPDAADDDPAAFSEHGGPGASPGTPNSFDD
jgi:hypothetical protein